MPTPTYVPIADVTLAATAAFVLLPIPTGYKDIVCNFDTTMTTGDYLRFRFNSDSGGNYSYITMNGYSGGPSSSISTGADMIQAGYSDAGQRLTTEITIFDINATDKHKSVLLRTTGYDAGLSTNSYTGRWASTASIATIRFHLWSGGNFAVGTKITLYGIEG